MSRNSSLTNKLEVSIDEPLTSEMKAQLRAELTKDYHAVRKCVYGRETKVHWISDYDENTGMFTLSNPVRPLGYRTLQKFCNKPTALYWAQSAQINDHCGTFTFACIYKGWYRCHSNNPNIEFGHFFANPIRITSTGPDTIAGILEAHKSLCKNATSIFDLIEQWEAGEVNLGSWPDPKTYRLLPLYRAIIVVLDELVPPNVTKRPTRVSLDEQIQRQTVLMVLTGDEKGLSAPIKFDAIRSQSLPLARADVTDKTEIIRVSLKTAIRFVADLELREEEAIPQLGRGGNDQSVGPVTDNASLDPTGAGEWVDKIMRQAEEVGANNVSELTYVAWKMKAEQRGDICPSPEFDNFSPIWQ